MTVTYRRVDASTSLRRSFTIVLGTVPGYDNARPLPAIRAVDAATRWMADRIASGKPYLTGNFIAGNLAYGWLGEGGISETEPSPVIALEPSLTFAGEVSVLYNADLRDGDVMDLLDELAGVMGSALEQTRVYLTYRSTTWVLEAEGRTTPRDRIDAAIAAVPPDALTSPELVDAINESARIDPQGTRDYLITGTGLPGAAP